MTFRNFKRMNANLKHRVLEGIAQSDARNLSTSMKEIVEKMTATDRKAAERFLMWACKNEIALKADTIEVRFHEFRRGLPPLSDQEAAEVWRAFNPESSVEELLDIVLHRDPELRMYVAANEAAPVDVLNLLSVDKDDEVRCRVAKHQKATAEILERLACDKVYRVRSQVAKNWAASAIALAELAGDTSWLIRADVAEHESADSHTLARLSDVLDVVSYEPLFKRLVADFTDRAAIQYCDRTLKAIEGEKHRRQAQFHAGAEKNPKPIPKAK